MSIRALKLFGWFVLITMIAVSVWASLEKSVAIGFVWLLGERWGIATLFDAGFGFMFFYLWILSRETSVAARIGWFVFVMLSGNIAMAIYFLRALYRLPADSKPADLFRRF